MKAESEEKMANTRATALAESRFNLACPFPAISMRADASTWRVAGLGLLLLSATLDHYTLNVAELHVKAEHIVALGLFLALAVVAARSLVGGRKLSGRRPGVSVHLRPSSLPQAQDPAATTRLMAAWPLVWLVLYLGVTLLSSVASSPDVGQSLKHTAMIAIVALCAVLAYWLADTADILRLGVRMLMVLGLLEAAYTFVVLIAANFGASIGTQPGNGQIVVPYGTLWEPNLLGSYLAASGVLLFSFFFVEADRRTRSWQVVGLLLILIVLSLSLARASWLGFFVGAGVVALLYFLAGKVHRDEGSLHFSSSVAWTRALLPAGLALVGTLAFLVLIAPLLFPTTARGILVRVNPQWYDPAKDPSVTQRANTIRGALGDITSHPIIGNGAGSYGVMHPDQTGTGGWISNLELHILYDSGILGLLAFVAGLGLLAWRALRTLFQRRDDPDPDLDKVGLRPQIIGLLAALAVLLFTFQATEGTWMAFFWVYLGLLARATYQPSATRLP